MPCTGTVLVSIRWGLHVVNRTPTSCYLQLETLLIGLFISWVVKLFSSVKIHKIQRIHMLHITVHIYCLITCNIKSLLIVPKISHISRKTCQVSRFLAKSSDSRNKFVFLPKQPPLSELSAPVIPIQ